MPTWVKRAPAKVAVLWQDSHGWVTGKWFVGMTTEATLLPAVRDARLALVERDAAAAEQAVRALLRIKREHVLKELARGATSAPIAGGA